MRVQKVYILILTLVLLLGFTGIPKLQTEESAAVLLTRQDVYTVGNPVTLSFKTEAQSAKLIVSNAFGTSIFEAEKTTASGKLQFLITEPYCKSSGVLNYTLIAEGRTLLSGKIQLKADTAKISKLESYLGPQRIAAGGEDFAQFTILPTDQYDNPLPDGTEILLNTGYANSNSQEVLKVNEFISWKNVHATTRSGRIFVAANRDTTTSKLQTIYVDANLATDFNIDFDRPNSLADADQLTTLKTSSIKDRFNNVVPDATLVNFVIVTNTGAILQTSGNTINGIAEAQIQHPAEPQSWTVTAYITGIAKSNPIAISYDKAVENIPANWDASNRRLNVGPLNGMLNQTLPEGTVVTLKISNTNTKIETRTKKTEADHVVFDLKKAFYPSGIYSLEISVLGVSRTLNSVNLK